MAEPGESTRGGRGRTVLGAVVKSCLRSLLLAAAVFVPGLLLVQEEPLLGSVWLLIGSFAMMAWTYRRPWRLMWVTCVIPPIAAIAVYACQLAIARRPPEPALLLVAAAAGLVVGLLRGRVHQVYIQKNAVFARRTIGYLLVWLVCYGATQMFALLRDSDAANVGRIGGAFSSMMLVAVAVVLGRKYARTRRELRAATLAVPAAVVMLAVGVAAAGALAQDDRPVETPEQAVDRLCGSLDFRWGPSNTRLFTIQDGGTRAPTARIQVRRYDSEAECLNAGNQRYPLVQRTASGWTNDSRSAARFERLGLGRVSFLFSVERYHTWRRTGPDAERRGQPSGVRFAKDLAVAWAGVWKVEAEAEFADADDDGIPWSAAQRRGIVVGMVDRALQRLGVAAAPSPVPPPVPPVHVPPDWTPPDGGSGSRGPPSAAVEASALIAVILVAAGLIADLTSRVATAIAEHAGGPAVAEAPPEPPPPAPAPRPAPAPPPPPPVEPEPAEPEPAAPPAEDTIEFTPGWDNTTIGWWINTVRGAGERARDELMDLPRQAFVAGQAAGEAAGAAAVKIGAALSEPEVWIEEGAVQLDGWTATAKDIIGWGTGDEDAVGRVGARVSEGAEAVGKVAGAAAGAVWEDPGGAAIAFIKTILGVHNWEKVLDGDRDLLERIARALWGAIETGGTLWTAGVGTVAAGGKVAGAVSKLDDMVALARGAGKSAGLAQDAGMVGRGAAAARGIGLVDEGVAGARGAGLVDEGVAGARGAGLVDEGAAGARGAGAANAGHLDDGAAAARGGGVQDDLARGAESAEEAGRRGAAGAYDDLPDMATDPEGYIRGLPEGAIIDQNLLEGTGYTGRQMDALKALAKRHNVTIGARSTNMDSMVMIRDGVAVPKPLEIKAKTISELDTYLGMSKGDKGLVGYFRPKRPELSKIPPHLRKDVIWRYWDRMEEYDKLRGSVQKMIIRGEVVMKDGKLYKVMEPGVLKPFAGDIDAVYFLDSAGRPLEGPAYDVFKKAWMESAVQGQHGAEFGVVHDLTQGLTVGSPEWHAAVDKALELAKGLSKGHMPQLVPGGGGATRVKEMVIECGRDGIFRKASVNLRGGLPVKDPRLAM